ncbi:hypothetical protein BGZ63DRAFT_445186, partial [Mariannaea sp. PMI_226]
MQNNFRKWRAWGRGGSRSSVGYASGKRISNIVSYSITTVTALLLVGVIISLYKTRSNYVNLSLSRVFITIIATIVGVFTNAKRVEAFGDTAAGGNEQVLF